LEEDEDIYLVDYWSGDEVKKGSETRREKAAHLILNLVSI
jgi:hypothetical protein